MLRSQARIHAAEGALYAGAIASACEYLDIPVIRLSERDVWSRASLNTRGISEAGLKAEIDAVRKAIGPPRTADHKIAMAAAMCWSHGSGVTNRVL